MKLTSGTKIEFLDYGERKAQLTHSSIPHTKCFSVQEDIKVQTPMRIPKKD